MMFSRKTLCGLLFMLSSIESEAFMAPGSHLAGSSRASSISSSRSWMRSELNMALDPVTYLRVEWVSAALCTNQTPRTADVCLQLGSEDGRAVTFIPRTIDRLITSTVEPDGVLPVSIRRQLTQQQQSRGTATVDLVDQRADDLKETPDESVDVVISLAACQRMIEKGLDWKKSVQEAARVLKPGGRLLFVEENDLNGESYLDYLANLSLKTVHDEGNEEDPYPVFEPLGYDDVDLVLTPHVAGVVVKAEDATLTAAEREAKEANMEKEKMAEISIAAFERGIKKRKRKKKKNEQEAQAGNN